MNRSDEIGRLADSYNRLMSALDLDELEARITLEDYSRAALLVGFGPVKGQSAAARYTAGNVTTETVQHHPPPIQELERVTIRFAGDSGDGMQLTGSQFTRTAAVFGTDIATLPDFPAEIRAPAGSPAGCAGRYLRGPGTGRPAHHHRW